MFQMLGVFAEFERGIIRERVNAGLARARRRARSWADVPLSRPLKNAYASSGPKAWAF
jgi:DNA invertase Pin-like site-specific DNA recombinase